jgi:hypothetical protein
VAFFSLHFNFELLLHCHTHTPLSLSQKTLSLPCGYVCALVCVGWGASCNGPQQETRMACWKEKKDVVEWFGCEPELELSDA